MNIEVRRPESEDRSKIRVSRALTFNLKLTAYRSLLLVLITLASSLGGFSQKVGTPVLTQQFDDAGEILKGYEPKIKEKIALVDKSTGSKIYLLTAYSYAPQIILNYADGWKASKNKGILMAINPWDKFTGSAGNWDKNVRIEVSTDLDQKLPLEIRQVIIKEIMAPLLDQKDMGDIVYYSAIMKGLEALMARWNKPVVPLPVITFVAAKDQKYGFDVKINDALAKYYKTVPDKKTLTYIPWKAIEANQNDVVEVTWDSKIKSFEPKALEFSTVNNAIKFVSKETMSDNRREVQLRGGSPEEITEVFASYPTSDTTRSNIAQLNVVAYQKLIKHLVVVSLPNAKNIPKEGEVLAQLNKIYGQAVTDWTVEVIKYVPQNWDEIKYAKIESGDGGLLSNYASEMRSINKDFKKNYSRYDEDTYYVFLAGYSESADLDGYMPRAKQFGYVFTKEYDSKKIIVNIAHELGHGAFHLKHTFDETTVSRSTSDNLMDYKGGVVLNKYQWDFIHDPVTVIGVLEKEEDAALAVVTNLTQLKDFVVEGSLTFMSPSGFPITLPANTESITFATGERWTGEKFKIAPFGSVVSFTLNKKKYKAEASISNNTFNYYKSEEEDYKESLTFKIKPARAIVGYPCYDGDNLTFAVYQKSIVLPSKSNYPQGYNASGTLKDFDFLLNFYINERSQASTIKIDAVHNLSNEAKEYLSFRKEYVKCDNPLAPYIFVHAYQITYHPGTYYLCDASKDYASLDPSRLDLLPLGYQEKSTITNSFDQYYNDIKSWGSNLDRYQKRQDALTKLKNLKDINDVDRLADLLSEFENTSCVWKGINYASREHALKKLLEGNVAGYWVGVGNNKESLFLLLLKSTPIEDRRGLLELFSSSKNEMLVRAYSKLDFDSNDEFIGILTDWLLKSKAYEVEMARTLSMIPVANSDITNNLSLPEKMFLWGEKNGEFSGKIIKESGGQFYCWDPEARRNINLDPYDIIKIEFFSSIGGVKPGVTMIVPVLWANRFLDNYYKNKLFSVARVLIDVAVIVSTAGTGTGIAAAIEIGFAATDIFIVIAENDIRTQFTNGESFVTAWDNLYALYGAAIGLKQLSAGIGKLKLSFPTKEIVVANLSKTTSNVKVGVKNNLKVMTAFLKQWGAVRNLKNWEIAYFQLLDFIQTIELQAVQKSAISTANRLVVQVKDYTKVVAFNYLLKVEIARFELRNGIPHLSKIKWLPAAYESQAIKVEQLSPVSYESKTLITVENAELEIVLAEGSFYVREKKLVDASISGVENGTGIGYLKEYETVILGGVKGDGAGKIVYSIENNPNVVIGIQRKELGNEFTTLDREIESLNILKDYGLPVTEIIGKTRHNGVPSIVMKKYEIGSRDIVNKGGIEPKIIGSSPFLNEQSIKDLENIKAILIEKKIHISDLQFLIGKDGSIVISDPLRIKVNASIEEMKKGLKTIDLLIEAAGKGISSRKIVDDFASFLANKGYSSLKNKFTAFDEVTKERFMMNFPEDTPNDILAALNNPNKDLLAKWENGTIKGSPNGFERYFYETNDPLSHSDLGDFSKPSNPYLSLEPGRMIGGGHGQKNIDYLKAIGKEYHIQHNFENGVRTGNVTGHKELNKAIKGEQSWFPESWTTKDINEASNQLMKSEEYLRANDGYTIWGIFKGVKVGMKKTNGNFGTIFPDAFEQPNLSGIMIINPKI